MESFHPGDSSRPRRHHRSAKSLGLRIKSATKSLCCVSVHCEIDRHDKEDFAPKIAWRLPTLPSSRYQSSRHYRGVGTPFSVRLKTLVRGFQPEDVPASELQPGDHEDSDDETVANTAATRRSSISPIRLPTYGHRRANDYTLQEASEAAPKISLTTPTTRKIPKAEFTAKVREGMMYDESGNVRQGLVVPQQLMKGPRLKQDGRVIRMPYFADEEPGWIRERKAPKTPLAARSPTTWGENELDHDLDLDIDPLSLNDSAGPSADRHGPIANGISLVEGIGIDNGESALPLDDVGGLEPEDVAEESAEQSKDGRGMSSEGLAKDTETNKDITDLEADWNQSDDDEGETDLATTNDRDSMEINQDQGERGRPPRRSSGGSEVRGGANADQSDSWKRRGRSRTVRTRESRTGGIEEVIEDELDEDAEGTDGH